MGVVLSEHREQRKRSGSVDLTPIDFKNVDHKKSLSMEVIGEPIDSPPQLGSIEDEAVEDGDEDFNYKPTLVGPGGVVSIDKYIQEQKMKKSLNFNQKSNMAPSGESVSTMKAS